MRLAYNLKAVFSSHAFLNFGRHFVVTACTHSNISLKSGGGGGGGASVPPDFKLMFPLLPQPSLPTPLGSLLEKQPLVVA